jgi:hypothetical protein
MKSKSSNSPRNTLTAKQDASGAGYAPSVPISVYRQLAAELQATKTLLESANDQNQRLTQQNQQLRQEIESLVQSAFKLQQIINPSSRPAPPANSDRAEASGDSPSGANPQVVKPQTEPHPAGLNPTESFPFADNLVFEQKEEPRYRLSSPKARDLSGLWLAIAIVVIIVSAFGAGFVIMRLFSPK